MAVAHAILGASIVTSMRVNSRDGQSKKAITLGALLAVCPDFDVFLLWVWGFSGDWHRGFSHSFTFVTGVGLFVWILTGVYHLREAVMYVSAILSHPLMDIFFSKDREGIELLWPFSAHRFNMGFLLYLEFPWDPRDDSMLIFLGHFIEYGLIEALIFSPLILLSYVNWKRPNRKKS